jgi:hypothetical protein
MAMTRSPARGKAIRPSSVLFHPDYTVGLGIEPSLLTPLRKKRALAG